MKYHGFFKTLGYVKGKPEEKDDFFKNADSVEFKTDAIVAKWESNKEILIVPLSNVVGSLLIQETEGELSNTSHEQEG